MKEVKILRKTYSANEVLGELSCEEFKCLTLERPDKNNQPQISCIPKGKYTCKYTLSPALTKLAGHDYYSYEVLNVPMRSGVRLHSGNYVTDIEGCILLGMSFLDINKDGTDDIINSRQTILDLEKFLNHEDFKLVIE